MMRSPSFSREGESRTMRKSPAAVVLGWLLGGFEGGEGGRRRTEGFYRGGNGVEVEVCVGHFG